MTGPAEPAVRPTHPADPALRLLRKLFQREPLFFCRIKLGLPFGQTGACFFELGRCGCEKIRVREKFRQFRNLMFKAFDDGR